MKPLSKKLSFKLAAFGVFFLSFSHICLSTPLQGPLFMAKATNEPIKRGQGVDIILSTLQVEPSKKTFLNSCYQNLQECIFAFSARSDYDKISLKPLILYPDVFPAYKYYQAINTASLLDLVSGYFNEPTSPFKPEAPLTRIQALKIILASADMVHWKEAFELSESEKFPNLPFKDLHEWWYGRYLMAAYKAGLIEKSDYFRPNDAITGIELNDLLIKTFNYQNNVSETKSSRIARR